MERLRKLKLSFQSFGYYYSRVAPNAADSFVGKRLSKCKVDQVPSKPHLPLIHQNLAKSASFSSSSYVRPRFAPKSEHPNPFSSGSKRFFSRGNTEEKEEGVVGAFIGVIAFWSILLGAMGALLVSSQEEVPYTHRYIVLIDSVNDRKLGEELLKKKKELEFKGRILPSTHPLSVKARFILKQLLDALHRDLGLNDTPRIAAEESKGEITRDKSGLRGMNWQVVVADKPQKEAYPLGGGIIVVSSGLLDQNSDAGIAAVLAHEVGHIVARHVPEFIRIACLPSAVSKSDLVDTYQRAEKEASYIGSQLMASAGYDPLEYENLEINYSECEENGPISLEETYTTYVARNVYRRPGIFCC